MEINYFIPKWKTDEKKYEPTIVTETNFISIQSTVHEDNEYDEDIGISDFHFSTMRLKYNVKRHEIMSKSELSQADRKNKLNKLDSCLRDLDTLYSMIIIARILSNEQNHEYLNDADLSTDFESMCKKIYKKSLNVCNSFIKSMGE